MKKFLTLALTALTLVASAQIDLKYNLQKGQKFKILMVMDQDITQDMMGQTMEQQQTITQGVEYEVLSASGGMVDMKCTFYRMGMSISAMGMDMSYDSKTGEGADTPFGSVFGALVNQSFTIKMNGSGEVVGISGIDTMLDKIVEASGQGPEMKDQLAGQFGDEAMTNSMTQALKYFPSNMKATKGQTWSYTTGLGLYDVEMTNSYTLSEYSPTEATISVSSVLEPSSFTQSQNGMDMEMNMSGTQSGTMTIERKTGMLLKGEITQDLTATANAMGMEIPMTIKTTNSFVRE